MSFYNLPLTYRLLLIALLFLVICICLRLYSRHPSHSLFFPVFTQFSTEQQQIALTFDDGPSPKITPALLDLLAKHQIKVTFFVNGNKLAAAPEVARRAVAEGHQLANHTYQHERMVFLFPSYIRSDLERTDRLILQSGQKDLSYFRPPYGDKFLILPFVLRQLGKRCVNWNVEPKAQYHEPFNKNQLIAQTVESSSSGSIILLHDGWALAPSAFLEAVDEIIIQLKQKGFSFVTIDEVGAVLN